MNERPSPRPRRARASRTTQPVSRGRTRSSRTSGTARYSGDGRRGVTRPSASSRRRTLVGVVAVIVVVLLVGIPAYTAWRVLGTPAADVTGGQAVQVVIPEGSGTAVIAERLAEAGVIPNAAQFRLRARIDGVDDDLRSGTYDLTTGMTYDEVVAALTTGPPIDYVTVTIPEGYNVKQIAARLEEQAGIPAVEFLDLADGKASAFAAEHPYLADAYEGSLEGFLFPKTYTIIEGSTAADVVELMLDQFDTEMQAVDVAAAADRGISVNELVVIASIIEREAQLDAERPLVSSVIYNRLAIGQKLEMCSTVQFILGESKERLTNADIAIESPYNTYLNPGLPPGPVASPGLVSLQAAAAPADTKYLYFVRTGEDGSHTFTDNYDDFLRAKQRAGE